MSKNLLILLYFTLVFHSFNSTAQGNGKTEALSSVLLVLQKRFEVQFNYASALVEPIVITPPDDALSLKEWVVYLSQQSKLKFVFVSDSIIAIGKKKILLCGYLKDKDDGAALPYVTIQNGKRGTIANEEGFFEIELDGANDIIKISHIGHKPISREARYFKTDECNTLYLVPDRLQLAEIVLYDYLIRGVDKLDDGSLQIDFDRFSILPGLIEEDVLQSVQALPGIQSIDETVSNINIRGGSNDQNLISWDAIKMYQSGHFFGLISMYNPNITQKVILRKNGSSASETDGVSGTIAMKTEERLNSNVKGSIGLNFIDGNGYIDAPIGQKASIQVAARKAISDFVDTPTYSQYFERIAQDTEIERNTTQVTNSDIAFDFYDTSFRLLFHPSENDHLKINFIYTANEVNFNESANISDVQEIRESNLSQNSVAGGLEYQRDWSETFDTAISIYETDYKLRAINSNVLENQRFLQENKVSETGLKLKANNLLTPQFKWINGYHFVETKVSNLDDIDNPRFILLEADVLRTHGIFSELAISSKNSATQLNLGIRFNYLDKFKKQLWEPRLSFNHDLGKGFNIEVLGEFKHQSTSQVINFQNDFLGVEKRRWQLSDDGAIPVIISKQISSGLSYSYNGWLANAVVFHKAVNGITTQSQGFQDGYEFVRSSGSYTANGLDFLFRKQFPNINTWLSYSYLDTYYSFKELSETQFPSNFDITHAITIGNTYTWNNFLFAAGLNWRTGKPLTPIVANNPIVDGEINYGDANSDRQKDYLRFDLSAMYRFKWGKSTKAQIGLAVWNLLDRDNTINAFYTLDPSAGAREVQQSSLGLTPNASFRINFD